MSSDGVGYGFRRRCGWCGVQLRAWQLNLCNTCRRAATGDAGIYLQTGGPPCRHGSRWNAMPDQWRRERTSPAASRKDDE